MGGTGGGGAYIPRELRAEALYRFEAWRFQEFQTPTLLLLGSESPTYLKEAAYMAEAVLPESRIAVLPGEGHLAMYSGPDLFLGEVLAFLPDPG